MTVEETKTDRQPEITEEKLESASEAAPAEVNEIIEPVVEPGRVVKIENLEEEAEYSDEETEVLTNLYEKTLTEFSEGEIVKGKILSVSDKEVAVDIGFKSEGVISIDEFKSVDDLKVGSEIEIFLDKMEDAEGQLKLSKEKADFARIWDRIVDIYEKGETIEGSCSRRIKGGMVVSLMGIDAFLPGSQIDVKPIRDFDNYIGKTMEFRVVKINQMRKNIVVSRRVIIEEGLAEQRKKMLGELERGQVRVGVVKNITDFGVFIDLGGVDGLLHITDLSWGRVSHPSEIVSFDQKLEVVVLDFDKEKERVSLGLKQLQPHPWENIEEKYPVGARVTGRVVSITDYGAFVELEKGIEGLIHISEMSWTQHIKHPSKILSIGEEVEAVVLNFNKEEKKISLGLKQIEPDPWTTVLTKYPVGSHHTGKVRNITNFGVFVELEEGIDGLVHISDLSWTKKIRHPSEVVKKGEEIEIIILNVSEGDRRISLGHKQLEENPWDRFKLDFKKGVVTTGKVVRAIDKGLIVELPGGVEGFVPASHIAEVDDGKKKKRKTISPGEEIPVVVIEFDKENKKIVLSQTEYLKNLEEKEVQEYLKQQKKKKAGKTEKTEETAEEKQEKEETAAAQDEAGASKEAEKEPEKKSGEKAPEAEVKEAAEPPKAESKTEDGNDAADESLPEAAEETDKEPAAKKNDESKPSAGSVEEDSAGAVEEDTVSPVVTDENETPAEVVKENEPPGEDEQKTE